MGAVYRATDSRLNRTVAIKILPAHAAASPDRQRRFIQEARSASGLNHPNIVHIYDIDTADDVTFIAMEFVDGRALDAVIAEAPLPIPQVLDYAIQAAGALAAAHDAGIVHRDVKPANILVNRSGQLKMLDFGLAKLLHPAADTETFVPSKVPDAGDRDRRRRRHARVHVAGTSRRQVRGRALGRVRLRGGPLRNDLGPPRVRGPLRPLDHGGGSSPSADAAGRSAAWHPAGPRRDRHALSEKDPPGGIRPPRSCTPRSRSADRPFPRPGRHRHRVSLAPWS